LFRIYIFIHRVRFRDHHNRLMTVADTRHILISHIQRHIANVEAI